MKNWLWCLGCIVLLACGSPEEGGTRGTPNQNRDSGTDAGADGGSGCDPDACDAHASCAGSGDDARCVCDTGYTGDGASCSDVDECASAAANDCSADAECTNRDGSYRCECNLGYSGDGVDCALVDLCVGLTNTCDPNGSCSAMPGAFECACGSGTSGDGFGCADVDECSDSDLFSCASNAECQNTFGGYACECEPLFAGDGADSCQPLCEVALANSTRCAAQGVCRIDRDDAVCDACAPGYEGTGAICTANVLACGPTCDGAGTDDVAHAVCNGAGGCTCAPGYTPDTDPNPATCTNIDECATANDCGSHASCIDTDGGYFCDCDDGYQKNASGQCVNIDECQRTPSPCHPSATCTDEDPSDVAAGFSCECKAGYEGDGAVCRDVNECEAGTDDCDSAGGRCINTAGSFQCGCATGYEPDDGGDCVDIDECARGSNDCAENATCVNEPGGYDCQCRAPFAGDDPSACFCDLSGYWAMRQDVDTCWDPLEVLTLRIISPGSMEASVWELHKLVYDGDTITVEKKGCGSDNTPDFISPYFRTTPDAPPSETYSNYIPNATFDRLDLAQGKSIPQSGVVPGTSFTTPDEAAVVGIDLGSTPETTSWPASHTAVNEAGESSPAWVDADGDGVPGFTIWPRRGPTDNQMTNYSYVPLDWDALGYPTRRAGCVSVGLRVITRLKMDVQTCTQIVGEVVNVKSEGRVRTCSVTDSSADVSCGADDWDAMSSCTTTDIDKLDSDQNQAQRSKATFVLERIGDLDDDVSCLDVRDTLPALERNTPSITCGQYSE